MDDDESPIHPPSTKEQIMRVRTQLIAGPSPDPCLSCTGEWDDDPGG